MSLYIKFEDVRVRTLGKVRFTDDESDENRMHITLARRLINEAEGDVEQDLSPRYAAPFQTVDGCPFTNLPERPTKEFLKTMCELKSVMRILETDFGRGTVIEGDKYNESISKRYDAMLAKALGHRDESYNNFKFPPLPGLRLNFHNTAADHGYSGQVLTTSEGDGHYPATRINDPSENFWNVTLDDINETWPPR